MWNLVGAWNECVPPAVANGDLSHFPLVGGLQSLFASKFVALNHVMEAEPIIAGRIIVPFECLQHFFTNAVQGSVQG